MKCVLYNSSFVLRLWEGWNPAGPLGVPRGLVSQPSGGGLPLLWRSNHLPLMDSHCNTLWGQVRSFHLTLVVVVWSSLNLLSTVSLPFRDSSPGYMAVYAGIMNPLVTLFNPAYSMCCIMAHEGCKGLTCRNDMALWCAVNLWTSEVLIDRLTYTGDARHIQNEQSHTLQSLSHLNTFPGSLFSSLQNLNLFTSVVSYCSLSNNITHMVYPSYTLSCQFSN